MEEESADTDRYLGRNAVDRSGRNIGSVSQVFVNDDTGRVDWISISTGLFGPRENYAPVAGSRIRGNDVVLPIDREVVKASPNSVATDFLTDDERTALSAYYQSVLTMADPHSSVLDPQEPSQAVPATSVNQGPSRSARD